MVLRRRAAHPGRRSRPSFLEAGLIDEVYWTIGPQLHGTDALPMIAPIPDVPASPRIGHLASVLRHEDELFLRYRFDR
jgi:riboflavin biosynthesis pyrimidine reductase